MTLRTRYAAATLGLLAVGAAAVLGQAWLERPAPPRPPRGAAGRPAPPVQPLAARDLLERADALGLTGAQRARLAALDRAWGAEAADLDRAVAAAGAEFERGAREAGPRGVSIAEIERQSAEYRARSAVLREARRRHADAARAILSEAQRQTVGQDPSGHGPGGTR
jgi:hypothetical protein